MADNDVAEIRREFYRRQGEQRERERIIKVLEKTAKCGYEHSSDQCLCDAIALIKGENK